jgi:hypothetical protein
MPEPMGEVGAMGTVVAMNPPPTLMEEFGPK